MNFEWNSLGQFSKEFSLANVHDGNRPREETEPAKEPRPARRSRARNAADLEPGFMPPGTAVWDRVPPDPGNRQFLKN